MIIGRPDNSIKNYWNSVLSNKTASLSQSLDKYLAVCLDRDKDSIKEPISHRTDILKKLLKFFLREVQAQYLGHLFSKR